jgi:hypothetical protein
MVEGIDEREGRCAIKGTTVIEGGGDVDRGLVHIGNAKVYFPHDGRGAVAENSNETREAMQA